MIFEAIKNFLNLILVQLDYSWYGLFLDITTLVLSLLLVFFCFVLPFYRLIKYGIFGASAKNKKWY